MSREKACDRSCEWSSEDLWRGQNEASGLGASGSRGFPLLVQPCFVDDPEVLRPWY